MKTLIISRHAKTEPYTSSATDYDRALTQRGHKDIILVAQYLSAQHPIPTDIYHSAAVRTSQTADDFMSYFKAQADAAVQLHAVPELYAADTSQIVDLIYTLPEDTETAMIIGHNPSIASFLYHCGLERIVPTTGTGVLQISADAWTDWAASIVTLEDFVTPKQFK